MKNGNKGYENKFKQAATKKCSKDSCFYKEPPGTPQFVGWLVVGERDRKDKGEERLCKGKGKTLRVTEVV